MQKLTLTVENVEHFENKPVAVKSECAMWKVLRTVRDLLTDADLKAGARAIVNTEDGKAFKDITFRRNAQGKIEMPNAVKETCRYQAAKAKKLAAQAEKKAEDAPVQE